MKIPKGKTVYIGGKEYKGEVPDCLSKFLPESLKEKPVIKTSVKKEEKK